MSTDHALTVWVAVGAVALAVQSCIFLVFAIGAAAAIKKLFAAIEEMKASISPVLVSSKNLLHETGPKIKKITENLEHISENVATQTTHLAQVVDDLLRRSRVHINQADAIVGHTLDTVEQTRASVTHAVMQPVRWATAMANGVATGVQRLFHREPRRADGQATAHPEAEAVAAARPWEAGPEQPKKIYRPWEPSGQDLAN